MAGSHPNSRPSDKAISTAPCRQSYEYDCRFQLQGWLQAHTEFKGLHCLHLQKVPPVACMFSKSLPCLSITVVSPEKRTEAKYFFPCKSFLKKWVASQPLLLQDLTASFSHLKYRTTEQQSSSSHSQTSGVGVLFCLIDLLYLGQCQMPSKIS